MGLVRTRITLGDPKRSDLAPIEVDVFGKRSCFSGAALGDDAPLGAIPMEDMDLVVRPATRDVVPDPLNPDIPASIAMTAVDRR